jgi:hypothetical protein
MNVFNSKWKTKLNLFPLYITVFFTIVLFTTACEENATQPKSDVPETIEELVELGNDFEEVVESEVVLDSSVSTFEEDGTIWRCKSKTISVTTAPEEYSNFNPNAEIMFPGNLLQGKTLDSATPEPISVSRAGGTIVMNILNGGGRYSETVPAVNLDNVNAAQNSILAGFNGPKPANFSFTMQEVDSEEQLALALKVNVKSLATNVKTSLSFTSGKRYNRFLVKLNQSYFTMIYQLPTSYAEVFAPGVKPEDLTPFIGPGNPATFISSITYGRIFYMLIESTESKKAMRASIDASFRAAVTNGSMSANAKYVSELTNREVKAFALGGDDQLALGAVLGGFEELKTYLTDGADIGTGVPLSYNVRALKKPYPVVKTKVATEYVVKDCEPIALNSQDEIFWYRADSLVIEQNGNIIEWGDSFGRQNKANLVPQNNFLPVTVIPNAIKGHPALRFWSKDGASGDYFQNNPAHLVNTNYTIFAVVNLQLGWYMWGADASDYRQFHTGYRNANVYTMDHYNEWLNINTTNLGDFQLFTLVFDVQNGMTIYENGVMRGTEPNNTHELLSNNNPKIGLRYWGTGTHEAHIAEISAYGKALDDNERKIVEEIIMRKYGLGIYGN